jgi:hypothetical protein
VDRLPGKKLADKLLSEADWQDLGHQLNRSSAYMRQRWEAHLQPWLLQHVAGTLNLRVEQMLVGHITELYTDRLDIDWAEVASKFAGHTINGLKLLFYNLERSLCAKKGLLPNDITLHSLQSYMKNDYKGRRGMEKRMERQRKVIDHFEQRVKELGITDHL